MSGIVELAGGEQLSQAAEACLEAHAVVVRQLVDQETAVQFSAMLPAGEEHSALSTFQTIRCIRRIPGLAPARNALQSALGQIGGIRDVPSIFTTIRPEQVRRGGLRKHIDKPGILASLSINASDDPIVSTHFYAERIAKFDATLPEVEQSKKAHTVRYPRHSVTLGVGDAVLISRGVIHKVEAGPRRVALLAVTRGSIF